MDIINIEILNDNAQGVKNTLQNFINDKFLFACSNNKLNVVKYFTYDVDYKLDTNAAIMIAVENNNLELLIILIENSITDYVDGEAYNLAVERNYTEIIDYFNYSREHYFSNDLDGIVDDYGAGEPVEEDLDNVEDGYLDNYMGEEEENEILVSDNPTVSIVKNRDNVICSQANQFEENYPIDPISLDKIPLNLFVSVVKISDYANRVDNDILNAKCYDARSLYNTWLNQARQNPPQVAADPYTREEFDVDSVTYVTELVEKYEEKEDEEKEEEEYYQVI